MIESKGQLDCKLVHSIAEGMHNSFVYSRMGLFFEYDGI